MRVDPYKKTLRSDQSRLDLIARTERITRIVAILVVFLSTFAFFLKILFF